jgi:2-desacetyl-2-hydroxyethyl bacteriochlorophyllide A dehydrogenase
MPKWLESFLGNTYSRIPPAVRPFFKAIFLWSQIRLQGLFTGRRVQQGKRVEFLDFEIAHLENYEFLTPGPNEVQVEAVCSTVSPGTERAVLCGLPGARRPFPYVPGYSTAGRVVRVGKNVKHLKVGDRVVGRMKHASAESASASMLFRIPDGVSYESASFMELGIITLQGIRKAGIKPGDRVAVLGQGLIGQLANRFARMLGAATVIAAAPSRNRAATALTSGGADEYFVLSRNGDNASQIEADVVIEAVGTPEAIVTAMKAARVGGKVILLGSSRGLSRDVDLQGLMQKRRVSVIGAHISVMPERERSAGRYTYQQEGLLFLQLLAARRVSVADLVTWRAAPTDCNAVYETIAKGGKEHVAIVFQWQDETRMQAHHSMQPATHVA